MKLPPLPSQTDGTEEANDPNTSVVSHSDHHAASAAYPSEKMAGPPLPTRQSTGPLLPPRPAITKQYSSQSFYSTEDQAEVTAASGDMPPSYEGGIEHLAAAQNTTKGSAVPSRSTEGMTDAEKREWAEHWRQEDELARGMEGTRLEQPNMGAGADDGLGSAPVHAPVLATGAETTTGMIVGEDTVAPAVGVSNLSGEEKESLR